MLRLGNKWLGPMKIGSSLIIQPSIPVVSLRLTRYGNNQKIIIIILCWIICKYSCSFYFDLPVCKSIKFVDSILHGPQWY